MPKYIAFLRAINVGGHTVKMDQLKKLFEALAFANVETFIASGNVIFDSKGSAKSLERKIEAHLETSLGYKVATFLRTPTELTKVVEHNPFKDWKENGEGTLYIGFLSDIPAREAQKKLLAAATAVDEFHIQERELYWNCRTRFSMSLFSGGRIEKILGMQTTLRNVNTVRKLAEKYSIASA